MTNKTVSSVVNSTEILVDSKSLYDFVYGSNNCHYYTYGTYSYTSINSAVSNNRYYSFDGNLIILRSGNKASLNDYFKNKKYEAYLKQDGKVQSVGSNDLVKYLTNAGFVNENIKQMTANFNKNNEVIIFTYQDGSMVGYDISDNQAMELFNNVVNKSPLKSSKPSLMSFVRTSLTSLFNPSTSSNTTQEREESQEIVNLMTSSNMSLAMVVNGLNETGELNDVIDDQQQAEALLTSINKENEKAEYSNAALGLRQALTCNATAPHITGVTDAMIEPSKNIMSHDNEANEYVLAYNEGTEKFDIYSIQELIEHPENPTSENTKVVDHSTLRSLYQTYTQEDNTDKHGITMYIVVAASAIVLAGAVILINKKSDLQ